jgi:hypothetical protein
MPVGLINQDIASAMLRGQRHVSLKDSAGELQIVYHLGIGRTHYCVHRQLLYFCASATRPVRETIRAVMKGMGLTRRFEPVCLDRHRLFNPAFRIHLSPEELTPVQTALRLIDVIVTRGVGA